MGKSDLTNGAHGRCIYHQRRVSRKEAREKCVVRGCKYFQNDKELRAEINADLDKLFEKR